MMRDQDFGVVRLRAFGTYDFKVVEVKRFLKEVVGSDHNFRLDEFADTMRSRIVSVFSDAVASAKVPALDIAARYQEVGRSPAAAHQSPGRSASTGSSIPSFILENVSVPPEVEAAIDKRSSMSAIGNLNDYVKYQMGQGMAQPRRRRWRGRVGGRDGDRLRAWPTRWPTSPAVCWAAGRRPARPRGVPPIPDGLTPADVARTLGVTEADVIATLEKGDLKGKKIGTAWRVTKGALDEFLKD